MRALLMLWVLLLAGAACRTEFPEPSESAMFRGDPAHRGVAPSAPLRATPEVRWRFQSRGPIYSTPAVAGGRVFFGSGDSTVYALDARSGRAVWTFRTRGPVHSSPAIARGLAYFGSYDGAFYAVDAGTGSERWHFLTGGERRFTAPGLHGLEPKDRLIADDWDVYLSSPVVVDTTVYFGSGDGFLYALDADSGQERWRFATGGIIHSSPAVAGGRVYFGSWDSILYAVDALTGRELWRYQTGTDTVYFNQTGIQSSPVVAEGTVYFGSRDAHLYALDAATGKKRWDFPTGGSWIVSTPGVHRGTVYFATSDSHRFIALDADTGIPRFEADTGAYVFASPTPAHDRVYVGTFGGNILGFDAASGARTWEFQTNAARADAADVLDEAGRIRPAVFASRDYREAPLAFARLTSVGSVLSSPVVVGRTLYFGSSDGCLYALH